MLSKNFSFPFEHSAFVQSDSDLNHESTLKYLAEVVSESYCLYIEGDETYFMFWNLGPKEHLLYEEMMIIKRKLLCIHIDTILDSLKPGYSIHLISLSPDNDILHTVFTSLEPLNKYNVTIYNNKYLEEENLQKENVLAETECTIM